MSGRFAPDVPAGAYEGLRPALEAASRAQRSWTPADGPLPALYVSHGAPPLLDDTEWMTDLASWAQRLPKPRGSSSSAPTGSPPL
jgi:4,5-DOPA dioxygenase extradiol